MKNRFYTEIHIYIIVQTIYNKLSEMNANNYGNSYLSLDN